MITDKQCEAFEGMLAAEDRQADAAARALLSKLSVAELRVLHKYYFACSHGAEMRKAHLLDELAPEFASREF